MDRSRWSLCLFDFANSSYSAVIAAVVFPSTTSTASWERGGEATSGGYGDLGEHACRVLSSPFLGHRRPCGAPEAPAPSIPPSAYAPSRDSLPRPCVLRVPLIVLANIGMEEGCVLNPTSPDRPLTGWPCLGWGFASDTQAPSCRFSSRCRWPGPGSSGSFGHGRTVLPPVLPSGILFLPGRTDRRAYIHAAIAGTRRAWETFKASGRERARSSARLLIYEDGVNTSSCSRAALRPRPSLRPDRAHRLYLVVQLTALIGAFLLPGPRHLGPKKVVILALLLWSTVAVRRISSRANLRSGDRLHRRLGLGTVQAGTRAFFSQFIPGKERVFRRLCLGGQDLGNLGRWSSAVSAAFGSQRPAFSRSRYSSLSDFCSCTACGRGRMRT